MPLKPLDPQTVPLTGIADIDAQHARLIALLNRLIHWSNHSMAVSATFDAIRELEDYVQTHFRYEEQYMHMHHYPDYAEHQAIHRGIEQRFAELTSRIYAGADATEELVEFVRTWITEHISVEDMSYSAYFQEGEGEGRTDLPPSPTSISVSNQ